MSLSLPACIRRRSVLSVVLLLAICITGAPRGRAQARVSDKDLQALMRNLRTDTKAFQPKFDNDIRKKSILRNTSQAKAAVKLMATFVRQTDELPKRFKKDRNGGDSFRVVQGTAEQLDATVSSAQLSASVQSRWQKIRAEVNQIAGAYNMPLPFGPGGAVAAVAPVAAPAAGGSPKQWLRITVFANVPIAGADIAVYDRKGKRIFEKKNATNDRGVYTARVRDLPRDFRVSATANGVRSQNASLRPTGKFTLSADVRNFDADSGVVYLNPATTLAADVADKLRDHDVARAQNVVRRYLVLPAGASLGAAMRQGPYYQSPYFSETMFLKQAEQNGGIDRFLNNLTAQAVRPGSQPHSFAGERRSPVAVAKFIGLNLASGALSWLGGQGVGWALGSGNKPEPGATKKDIQQLQDKLGDLQSSVNDLSNQLTNLSDELKAELTEVKYTQYVVPALSIASLVDTVEEEVRFYADDCPPIVEDAGGAGRAEVPEGFCNDEKMRISRKLEDNRIGSAFQDLSTFLLPNGPGGSTGMVRLYSQSLATRRRFFRPADSTKMEEMFDYWYSVQIQAANLRVEDWHFAGKQNTPGGRQQLQDFLGYKNAEPPKPGRMQNTLEAEAKLMYPPVPANTVVNTRDGTMWLTSFPAYSKRPGVFHALECGPPPNGGLDKFPVTKPVEMNGMQWTSPTAAQLEALVLGWTGKSAMAWVTANTRSVAPDVPTSAGMLNVNERHIVICLPPKDHGYFISRAWSKDSTGDNGWYSTLDLVTGKITRSRTGGDLEGLYLARELRPGEQYYWKPAP